MNLPSSSITHMMVLINKSDALLVGYQSLLNLILVERKYFALYIKPDLCNSASLLGKNLLLMFGGQGNLLVRLWICFITLLITALTIVAKSME